MPFRVSDKVVNEVFARHGNTAKMWEWTYVSLRYAMETLARGFFEDFAVNLRHRSRQSLRPSLHPSMLMLAGMMLEALAKAVLISRKQHQLLRKHTKHSLRRLIKAVGVGLNQAEAAHLDNLSHYLRWAGRYPVPLSSKELTVLAADGSRNLVGGGDPGGELVQARSIADRLEHLLPRGRRIRTGMRLPSGSSSADPRAKQRRRAKNAA